jgi:hypothetical protein
MIKKLYIPFLIYLSFSWGQQQSQKNRNKAALSNQIELITATDSLSLIPVQLSTPYDSEGYLFLRT